MKLLACAALAALAFTTPASAKLSPGEQRWLTPLLQIFNVQNAGLHVVLQQAAAKNALVAGTKPQNLTLTKTLGALVDCKSPKDLIQKAGPPPTKRLAPFRDALNAACIHDANGANDLAKAIGAITKGQQARAKLFITQGALEFRKGSAQLTKAYGAITALKG